MPWPCFRYLLIPETMSPIHVRSEVSMAPFHLRSKVCIAPFKVRNKFAVFALHIEGRNTDFVCSKKNHQNLTSRKKPRIKKMSNNVQKSRNLEDLWKSGRSQKIIFFLFQRKCYSLSIAIFEEISIQLELSSPRRFRILGG